MQTYQTEENQIYSENYASMEYNEISVSQEASEYYVAPDNDVENNTALKSSSQKTNSLISSTLLTSSGILAGVTVIVSALVTMILLKISVIAAIVAPCSLEIKLSIQSGKDLELSAFLTGNGEEYVALLDYSDGECDVRFDFLTPDTEYYFAVKDADGNTYFSEIYRTEQYEETISPEEFNFFGSAIFIAFDASQIAEDKEYEVYVGTLLIDARLTKNNAEIYVENLSPNTEYVFRVIDPDDGSIVYYARMSSGNYFESTECYVNSREIALKIDEEYIGRYGYPLDVYFDGKLNEIKIHSGNNSAVFKNLEANKKYEFALYDPVNDVWPLIETVSTSDIEVNVYERQSMSDSITIEYEIISSEEEQVIFQLRKSDGVQILQEKTATSHTPDAAGNVKETVFSGLDAYTEYLLVIVRDKDGTAIFQGAYQTTE